MELLAAVLGPDTSTRAKRLHFAGVALIFAAFALPFLAIPVGYGTAYEADEGMFDTLAALFALALVAWVTTRERDALAKAVATFSTGVLLVLFVVGRIALAGP